MERKEFFNVFWDYYLILESEFINTLRYIELDEDNYSAYSIEFVKLYQSICSEVDVICKVICEISPDARSTIKEYAEIILEKYSKITTEKIMLKKNKVQIKPFESWNKEKASKSLFWWNNYNNIKHSRVENFEMANLKNILYSLAGLYILELYTLKQIDKSAVISTMNYIPSHNSQLFVLEGWRNEAIFIVPPSDY